MTHETTASARRERLARAERLLDRWLDLFEQALDDARPDASRTTELANIFTICRRILEIERLQSKQEDSAEHACPAPYAMDPNLFGDGIPDAGEPD